MEDRGPSHQNARRTVILDMDGLMLDTERIARDTWRQAARELACEVSENVYLRVVGRTAEDAERILKREFGQHFPHHETRNRMAKYVEQYFAQHGVPKKPGIVELLDFLDAHAIPTAVATSTHRSEAEKRLAGAKLLDRFRVLVAGDEVARGKPAPDLFLAAAERLAVPPEVCIVLEDSEPGIRAARAAGMFAIMIPDLKAPSKKIAKLADRIIPSLPLAQQFLAQEFA